MMNRSIPRLFIAALAAAIMLPSPAQARYTISWSSNNYRYHELVLVRVPFVQFTDALADGTVDIVSAGYSITPQRALAPGFRRPRS